jgi:membrane protein implicated in regulation of membrane protease activity
VDGEGGAAVIDFFRDTQWLLWILAALVLGLLELLSFDFVFSMLVIGALAASGAAFLGYGFTVQVFAFAIASVLGLILVRPLVKRWLTREVVEGVTNVDALVGRTAVTLAPVDVRSGQVKLVGETWSARTENAADVLPAGIDVTVVRIEGATAVVAPTTPQSHPAQES